MEHWIVKVYVNEAWTGVSFFGDQREVEACEAFHAIGDGLGNPLVRYSADILVGGDVMGYMSFSLEHVNKVELVLLTNCKEEVIDTIVNEPPGDLTSEEGMV